MSGYSLVQRTAQKQLTLPRLPVSRRFAVTFVPIWVVLFGATWGVSYGWKQYMEGCCSSSVGKHSYTFIAWIISFCIFLWTLISLYVKISRVRAVYRIVNFYMRIVDELVMSATSSSDAVTTGLSFYWKGSQKPYFIEYHKAFVELLLALTASLMLFIYENTFVRRITSEEALLIVRQIFYLQSNIPIRTIEDMFQSEISLPTIAAGDGSFSVLMMTLVMYRISEMSKALMFGNTSLIITNITQLKEEIDMFTENPLGFANDWWIMWPVMFIGIVFPFLIPPIFFSTMADDILYIGPVLFFFIGSPVLINIVLGDPLRWPSDIHMQQVYTKIRMFTFKIYSKYKDKFNGLYNQLEYNTGELLKKHEAIKNTTQATEIQAVITEYNFKLLAKESLKTDLGQIDYLRTSVVAFMPISEVEAFSNKTD